VLSDFDEDYGSSPPSELLSVDSNTEELSNHSMSKVFSQLMNFDDITEEEAPETSYHTDFQNPHKSSNLKSYYDPSLDLLNNHTVQPTPDLSRKTIGSGLQKNRSAILHSAQGNSMFPLVSPFERSRSEEEIKPPVGLDNREGRFSFFHSPPKFLSPCPIVIPEINS